MSPVSSHEPVKSGFFPVRSSSIRSGGGLLLFEGTTSRNHKLLVREAGWPSTGAAVNNDGSKPDTDGEVVGSLRAVSAPPRPGCTPASAVSQMSPPPHGQSSLSSKLSSVWIPCGGKRPSQCHPLPHQEVSDGRLTWSQPPARPPLHSSLYLLVTDFSP